MQGNEGLNIDVNALINNFTNRIAQLTSEVVLNESIITQLKAENEQLKGSMKNAPTTEEKKHSGGKK